VLGIDPCIGPVKEAINIGVPTLHAFFGTELAKKLASEGKKADIVHANNVMAHVADLNGFIAGIATILKDTGSLVTESPYVKDLIDHCEFDTIYHEHLCYFSVTALDVLVRRHGLSLVDVQRVPIHGGSLRLRVTHERAATPAPSVPGLLAEEEAWGVRETEPYRAFAARVRELEGELVGLLGGLRSRGARIAAYGAAAKGSTLLNVFGIGRDTIEFVVDRSVQKQGKYMPGVKIPIEPPERLLDLMPEYVLLLAWNLADEVVAQQDAYRRQGGRFIVPVPEPKVLEP